MLDIFILWRYNVINQARQGNKPSLTKSKQNFKNSWKSTWQIILLVL